jgi:hypothetical protein
MARVLALESSSLARRRISMRHSVTSTVKAMYSATAPKVTAAKRQSNRRISTAATSANSSATGRMENSRYESSVEMPLVPRSMSRVMPPVWRSR